MRHATDTDFPTSLSDIAVNFEDGYQVPLEELSETLSHTAYSLCGCLTDEAGCRSGETSRN